MKKAIFAVAGLVVAASVSIGAFVYVKSDHETKTKQEAETTADNVLYDFDGTAVSMLEISYAGDYFKTSFNGEEWLMSPDSSEVFDLNQSTVKGICTAISNLTADMSYGEADAANKEKYGLTDPYTVTFTMDDGAHTLYIGDMSPTGDYYYAYTDTKNKVYAIPARYATSILTTRLALKNSDLTSFENNDIIGIDVKRSGSLAYTLTKDTATNTWSLPEEYSLLTVNQTTPGSMLALITRLTAEVMVEQNEDDVQKYGFDKPDAELILKGADGSVQNILIRFYGKDTATYIYAYLPEQKQVEIYYTADLDFIDYTYFDFIMQNVECANVNVVAELELSYDGMNESFTFDHEARTVDCRGTVLDLGNAEISNLYDKYYNTFSYIKLLDIDIVSKPDIADSVFTAKYTLTDGTVKTFDFVPAGTERMFVFIDGEYTGTRSSSAFLNGSESVKTAYELLCRQTGITPLTPAETEETT